MFEVGDYLQNFKLPATTADEVSAHECVGRPLLITFFGRAASEADAGLLVALRERYASFRERGVTVLCISLDEPAANRQVAERLALPFPVLSDASLTLSQTFGVVQPAIYNGVETLGLQRCGFLFDTNMRVIRVYTDLDPESYVQRAMEDVNEVVHRESPRDMDQFAPVLVVPNVLPGDLCGDLMKLWESGNEDSGFMVQRDGQTVAVTDHNHKIRRDHYMTDGILHDRVKQYVTRSVIAEIRKAFNFAVTRREDFRIACYDASVGGYFRPHRDNTTTGTAHRRFAMSLLLNDEYEGGYVRFPEYGPHRYRPGAGAAVVFSCSLLHEATDVTAGRRFVLLSFFYGEAEARAREEYNRRAGGGYRA